MFWIHFVTASLGGVVLLSLMTWNYLVYDYIPNVVTIEQVTEKRFDYVIVGAGTVGSVLVNRLSVDPNVSVLIIEAGGQFGPLSTIPLLSLALQKSEFDWSYVSTSQKHSSRGLVDNKQFLPRGKGLGGSSQINYLLHFGGKNSDFDAWEAAGAKGWGRSTMRTYLEKINCCDGSPTKPPPISRGVLDDCAEDNQCPAPSTEHQKDQIEPKLYTTEFPSSEFGISEIFARIFNQNLRRAHPSVTYTTSQSTTYKGTRWNAYHAYLRPTFSRPNVHILANTRVHSVRFNANNQATSVIVSEDTQPATSKDTHEIRIAHNGEIILSAGAYGTPHILMLSGVGPAEELDLFKIPLVAKSPNVGRNLHEHMTVPLFVAINETISMTTDKIFRVGEVAEYLMHGTGFFSRFGVVGFVNDVREHHSFGIFGAGTMDESVLRDVANCKEDVFRAQFPLYKNTTQEGFVILNTCQQPKSRGTIKLNARHTRAQPAINPNFLADIADVRCIIRSIRLAVETVHGNALQRIGAQIYWPKLSGCQNFGPFEDQLLRDWPSDRYLECLIRTIGVTAHHPAGTCAMGDGEQSCTDPRLNVRGVSGLRVADASVIPTPVSGTPNTVLMAVGERAADIILSDRESA